MLRERRTKSLRYSRFNAELVDLQVEQQSKLSGTINSQRGADSLTKDDELPFLIVHHSTELPYPPLGILVNRIESIPFHSIKKMLFSSQGRSFSEFRINKSCLTKFSLFMVLDLIKSVLELMIDGLIDRLIDRLID
jgi:hypothetical protein